MATFTYRANDGVGLSDPAVVSITVNAVNDAPVLDPSGDLHLNPIVINDFNNPGTLLSDILASGGGTPISDVDAGALQGVAITQVDNTNGAWQYTTDGGASWNNLAPVSPSTARLLAVNANTRLRFVPNTLFNGPVDPGVAFLAWDQTSGAAGGTGDASSTGGSTAFSVASETARIFVNNQADLSIQKGVSTSSALAGLQVQYTFTVTNAGPADATGVMISDTLPVGVSYASGDGSCYFVGGVVTCAVGGLSANASVT